MFRSPFKRSEVVEAVRRFSSNDENVDLSHCKLLNERAKLLGYQSFIHFKTSMEKMPRDDFNVVSLKIMREICATKLPRQNCAYYEFQMLPNHGVGFYSMWIGWDKNGEEVRAPRPLHGRPSVEGLRKVDSFPVYVTESMKEFNVWQNVWGATAYVPETLAKAGFPRLFNREALVVKDVPFDLIKSRSYQGNFEQVGGETDSPKA